MLSLFGAGQCKGKEKPNTCESTPLAPNKSMCLAPALIKSVLYARAPVSLCLRKCQTHGLRPFLPRGKAWMGLCQKSKAISRKVRLLALSPFPGSGCSFGDSLLREGKAVTSQPEPERADGLAFWEHSGIFLQGFHRPRDSSRKTRSCNQTRGSGQQSIPRSRLARGDNGVSCKQVSLTLPALLHMIPLSPKDISWICRPMATCSSSIWEQA